MRHNGHARSNGHDPAAGLRFKLTPFDQIALSSRRAYLIKGLIPREGLVVLWGPPKCGKSFLTLDLVMHIALGWPYRGRRVAQGPVVYVACEGEQGLAQRIEAFRQDKLGEAASVPFFLVTTRLNMAEDAVELATAIAAQIGDVMPSAIVIDTLNRSLAGSESKDEDMSAYVGGADYLRARFSAAIVLIHHCGTNGERPRGHSSLTGAADAQIAVSRNEDGQVLMLVEAMKDGPEGTEIASILRPIDVGEDEDGEVVTSCVIDAIDEIAAKRERQVKLPPDCELALQQLRNVLVDEGGIAPPSRHMPANIAVAHLETWRRACEVRSLLEKDANGRKKWQRIRERLMAAGIVGIHDDYVWLCKAPKAPSQAPARQPTQDRSTDDEFPF